MTVTRRAVLADTAALGADAQLLQLLATLRAEQAMLDRWNASDSVSWAEGEAANARWWSTLRRLLPIQARTPAGVRAKAEAVRLAIHGTVGKGQMEVGYEAALALVRDVLAMVAA